MTVVWPTSRKHEQGKRRVLSHPWLSHWKSTPHGEVQGCALCTSIYLILCRFKSPRRNCWSRWCQNRRGIVCYILNLFICKIFMRYSKTNTTWFISRSSKNSWSLGVGCMRLLPSASSQEVVSRIRHLGTSNFYYLPQYHVVSVYYSTMLCLQHGSSIQLLTWQY